MLFKNIPPGCNCILHSLKLPKNTPGDLETLGGIVGQIVIQWAQLFTETNLPVE